MSTSRDRSSIRKLILLLPALLALVAAVPCAAQKTRARPPAQPRPVPARPKPSTPTAPGRGQALSFGVSALQVPTVIAGDTYTESIPLGCDLGPSTANLSVTVDPPAFGATVSPTQVSTPGRFTLTATTLPTTPSNEYRLTVTATPVRGPCLANSTTRLILVVPPARLEVQPASQTITAGQSTSYTVTIRRVRRNFTGSVALRTSGLPSDIRFEFSPPETTGNTSTLTLSVPPGSTSCPPPAGCDFRIRGRASVEVQAVPAQLVVRKQVSLRPDATTKSILTGQTATFSIQVLRSGYAGTVKLNQETIEKPDRPAVSSGFNPDGFTTAETVSFEVKVDRGGEGRYRFRLTPSLPASMPDVTLVPVEVTVEAAPPRGVDITVTPASISIPAGGSATYQIRIVKSGVPSVRFDINGLPPKAQAFPDSQTDPTSVRIETAPDTPERTYSLTVLGVYDEDGTIVSQQANSVDLVVGPPLGGNVILEADPAVKDIDAGSSRTFAITVRPQGGFRGMVALNFQPPPSSPAVQPSFSIPTADLSSGNPEVSILTLAVPAGTSPGGPFAGMVTGTASPLVPVQSATVNYRILSAVQPALALSLSPATFDLQSGQTLTLTATVTRLNGCQGPITLSGFVTPFNAFGAVNFQPVSGSPDTFRADLTAGTVTAVTPTTISVSAFAAGCAAGSRSISGTVRPKILIPPAVTASIAPAGQSAAAGQTVAYTLQLNRGMSTDAIGLTITGLPAGISATASPNPVTGASAQIQVTVGGGAPAGSFTFTVTGRIGNSEVFSASAGLTLSNTTTVTVTAPTGGTFQEGQPLLVQWQTQGPVSFHTVRLSIDGGPFVDVSGNLAGMSFTFPLPRPPQPISQAVIRVAAKDASGTQIAKGDSPPFSLRQAAPPASLTVSPSSLSFSVTQGGPNPPAQALSIGSTGSPLSIALTGNAFWLSVSPASATTPVNATVSVNPAGLAPGSYNAAIQVSAAGAANSPLTVPVTLTVNARPGPVITGFSPTSGPIGTTVRITGSGLATRTDVRFNGVPGSASLGSASDTEIFVTVQPVATSGSITVITPTGSATSAGIFTVQTPTPPAIDGFTPGSGPVGTQVTIQGRNLRVVQNVFFNGQVAAFQETADGTSLGTTVPPGATTGPIRVVTANGQSTSAASFQVVSAAPTGPVITGFSPTSGPIGTTVRITGSGLATRTDVRFNGVLGSASLGSATDTEIFVTVQPVATSGPITVTTPSGSATSAGFFTVETPTPPVIDSFAPGSGPVGTQVTIQGSNLRVVQNVFFNGQVAVFSEVDGNSLRTTVPPGARTGPIRVVTANGQATSAASFIVSGGSTSAPAPTITGLSPTAGPPNTQVTIFGSNLGNATVTFGGVPADQVVPFSSGLTTFVPFGARVGTVPVVVTTPNGTASSFFTVTQPPTQF